MPCDQLQFSEMLHSLDFPGRTVLRPQEIAKRLGVSDQHILNAVEEGSLQAVNLAGAGASKRCLRIPVESYRDWVLRRLTNTEERRRLLRDLPKATLRELRRELDSLLAA